MTKAKFFVCAALPPPVHGQSVATAAVVDFLSRCGHSVTVCDISPQSLKRDFSYHIRRILRVLAAAFKLLRFSLSSRGANFYCVFESGLGAIYNILLLAVVRFSSLNIVMHHHTSKHAKKYSVLFALVRKIGGKRFVHVVLSDRMASDLRRLYGDDMKVIVQNNAAFLIDSNRINFPEKRVLRNSVCFGMLANHSLEKGSVVFLDIIRSLIDLGCDCSAVMAGPIDEAVMPFLIRFDKDFPGRLVNKGPLYGEELKDSFFDEIDLFLFPSCYKYEAQPIVLLEALSRGVPCIASDRGYISELIGSSGIVLGDDIEVSVEMILGILRECADNLDYYKDLSRKSYLNYTEVREQAQISLESFVEAASALY